jgi:hypothetical protein
MKPSTAIEGRNMSLNYRIYLLLIVYSVLAALCFFIPWIVPVQPAASDSFAFGFSNKAFFMSTLFLFIVPAFIHFRFMGQNYFTYRNLPISEQNYASSQKYMKRIGLIAYGISILFLMIISNNLEGYGEAEFFLLRSALVTVGKVPYTDFDYCYGPFLIYGLSFLKAMGLSAGLSETLLIIVESIVGYISIFYITKIIFERHQSASSLMFWALFLATCLSPLWGGQNYTYFRFATALAVACFLININHSKYTESYGLLSGMVFLLGWFISPEVGLAAGMAFAIVSTLQAKRPFICGIGAVTSVVIAFFSNPLILKSYAALFQFVQGTLNFPGFPSFHLLLLFVSIFFATAYIAQRPVKKDPVAWLLFLYSIGMLPAALGRCDPGHVIFNAFGFFILAGKFLSESREGQVKYFSIYCLFTGFGYFLLIMIANLYFNLVPIGAVTAKTILPLFPEQFTGKFIRQLPPLYQESALNFFKRKVDDAQIVDPEANAYVLNPRSNLNVLGSINIPYFVQNNGTTNASSFNKLAAELKGKPVYIRFNLIENLCKPYVADTKSMMVLFAFPTMLFKQKNYPEMASENICSQLKKARVISKGVAGGYTKVQM